MIRSNLAFKNTETAGPYQEYEELKGHEVDQAYIGGSTIRRLVGKTESGEKIEEYANESNTSNASTKANKEGIGSTAAVNQTLPIRNILPKRNILLQQTAGYSIVLQKWNGYIESISGKEFTGVLTDPSGKSPDIKATFSIDEVSRGDRALVQENALFDWVVCRETKSYGTIENKDFLIFKRFPMWKKSDLEEASAEVDEFDEWLNSDNTH